MGIGYDDSLLLDTYIVTPVANKNAKLEIIYRNIFRF